MRSINGWLTVFWIVMIPISVATGWIHSVAYVSALSLWALVSGHWSAWQAARVEVEQAREVQEAMEHPPEEKVVETLVKETTIEKLPGSQVGEDTTIETTTEKKTTEDVTEETETEVTTRSGPQPPS